MISVSPITEEGFAPYGEVFPAHASPDRALVLAAWTATAEDRYGGAVAARTLALPAKPTRLSFIEAHPNSPQLSVAFDSLWILAVVPGIRPGTEVGRDADVSSTVAFLVPAGTGVILRAGLWHGPVTVLRDSDVLVIFREGVVDVWTELDNAPSFQV